MLLYTYGNTITMELVKGRVVMLEQGSVYLVGAGPGDAGLLTVKG
ncbi:hypothetical protein [Bacillus sp. JCM 19041]